MRDHSDPLQKSGPTQPDSESGGSEDRLLRLFVGPNADKFLQIHRRMEDAKSKKRGGFFYGLNWIVLFVPIVWYFYRKMFLAGAAILLVPPILILVFPALATVSTGGLVGMLVVLSNRWYVERAIRKIRKIEELGLPSDERDARIRQSGGTSKFGAFLGSLIYVAIFALFLVPEPDVQGPVTSEVVPQCTHPDVVASAEKAMRDRFEKTREEVEKVMRDELVKVMGDRAPKIGDGDLFEDASLQYPAMVDEKADPPRRRCRAILNLEGRNFTVFYNVMWRDPSKQVFRIVLASDLESMPD